MSEEIKIIDNNCIIKAFENNPISILKENSNNKNLYYFKGTDIAKALNIINIRQSIINYDDDERVVRKVYDPYGTLQDTIFLTSQGVYRLLYNSKKELAKKFRKWTGNILDDIIFNESKELKRQLEEKNKELESTKKQLETKTKLKVKKWYQEEPGHIIYGYKSNEQDKDSIITIGKTKNVKKRESSYMTCNQSGVMFYAKRCYNCDLAEKVIHHILDKYREESNKEWFNISEELTIYVIDIVCGFLDTFIDCSEKLPEFKIKEFFDNLPIEKCKDINNTKYVNDTEKLIKENLVKENLVDELLEQDKFIEDKTEKSSKYMGVLFYVSRQNWLASKTFNKKEYKLGYYETELEAAKAYNDYVSYLNCSFNKNYKLNKIENYKSIPRNIPEENKQIDRTSEFLGVHYDNLKKYYSVSIYFNKKQFYLGCNHSEVECAKLYNQQALYYNNTYNTNYELNNISEYKTVAKDVYSENQERIIKNKCSKWIGVSTTKKGNFRSYLKYNNKQQWLGEFELEIDAAKVYNDYASYLNNEFNENYILNNIPNYINNPKNIPEIKKKIKNDKKITKYTGVTYNSLKKLYFAQINFNNRRYPLGYNKDEIECGKLYNQQALYFNEKFGTEYELNNIENYITIAKNINEEYENNKNNNKSSKYHGVNKLPDGRYIALLVFNNKQIKLGKFLDEIDAAKAYNKKAIELNKDFNKNYKINLNL
jgi:prophage antirepressor-like protein